MTPRQQKIEALKREKANIDRIMAAHERRWQDEWDTAVNAFVAWQEWISKPKRAERRVIIAQWLEAKAKLERMGVAQ